MKKLFILLFVAVSFSFVGNSQNYNYDVNGDGAVTAADITAIYDYLLGNVPSSHEHEYVDLGLPSGTLWATMNIGASCPEDYGDYFAWGETTPKDIYDWCTYKWCDGCSGLSYTFIKYTRDDDGMEEGDYLAELEAADDAAMANWGSDWCMPTVEQFHELVTQCTWMETTSNGVAGYRVSKNGKYLFLPAGGLRKDGEVYYSYDTDLLYWSRTNDTLMIDNAMCLSNLNCCGLAREFGGSVRAVRVSQN